MFHNFIINNIVKIIQIILFCLNLCFSVSLKCSMDFQCSDGFAMLLKYAASYVTKMKDRNISEGLMISLLHLTIL